MAVLDNLHSSSSLSRSVSKRLGLRLAAFHPFVSAFSQQIPTFLIHVWLFLCSHFSLGNTRATEPMRFGSGKVTPSYQESDAPSVVEARWFPCQTPGPRSHFPSIVLCSLECFLREHLSSRLVSESGTSLLPAAGARSCSRFLPFKRGFRSHSFLLGGSGYSRYINKAVLKRSPCFIVREELLITTEEKKKTASGHARGAARDEGKHGITRHTRQARMEMNFSSSITLLGIFLDRRSISPVRAEF